MYREQRDIRTNLCSDNIVITWISDMVQDPWSKFGHLGAMSQHKIDNQMSREHKSKQWFNLLYNYFCEIVPFVWFYKNMSLMYSMSLMSLISLMSEVLTFTITSLLCLSIFMYVCMLPYPPTTVLVCMCACLCLCLSGYHICLVLCHPYILCSAWASEVFCLPNGLYATEQNTSLWHLEFSSTPCPPFSFPLLLDLDVRFQCCLRLTWYQVPKCGFTGCLRKDYTERV